MRKRNNLLKIGLTLIFLGISLFSYKIYVEYSDSKLENAYIERFLDNQNNSEVEKKSILKNKKEDYIAILEIPKINLKKGLSNRDSYYNNVNKNIEILKEADMPDIKNGNFIIAGHSGTGRAAFFKNIDKLGINDEIFLYYDNKKYTYKIVSIYEIEKIGIANIYRNPNISSLTIITCKRNTNKQIVLIAEIS